jgi:CRISPR system Cascade subunit CasE
MYLSQLKLNPAETQVKRDLANPYELHRTIMRAFPTPLPERERVLFRVENILDSGIPFVLVQSQNQPDWKKIEQQYSTYFSAAPQVKALQGLQIKNGDLLRFRLRANPTKRVLYESTQQSQRISLFSEEDRKQWLRRKSQISGFSINPETLLITDAPYRTIFIAKEDKTYKATINMVDFNGVLKVDDVEKLLLSLARGIGPAKGLGCGMLSLSH